jgi:hypothetical protein
MQRLSQNNPGGAKKLDLQPHLESPPQRIGQIPVDDPLNLVGMKPGTEMRGDDHLVFEPVGPGNQVVEMGVAKLVDQRRALIGRDKGHLEDQDLHLVDRGERIEARRRGIAHVGDPGKPDLGRNLDAREP